MFTTADTLIGKYRFMQVMEGGGGVCKNHPPAINRNRVIRAMGGVFHAKCTDAESREMMILAKIQPRTKNKQRKCAACSLSQCVCNRNIIFYRTSLAT